MTDSRPIIIIGAGGHGRVVLDTCQAAGLEVTGFLDTEHPRNTDINGTPVIGDNALLGDAAFIEKHRFLVAIGEQQARHRICRQLLEAGAELATAIHPSCIVSPSAHIGAGTVLVAGSIVNANAHIGRYCIINTAASIDHDNRLEDGVQICPGARLAGHVHCGERVFVGTAAAIAPHRSIGADTSIGAGAVVLQDIPANVLAAGNPARIIRPIQ